MHEIGVETKGKGKEKARKKLQGWTDKEEKVLIQARLDISTDSGARNDQSGRTLK